MSPFSQILLLAVIIGLSFPSAVRSEYNPIQLPSDDTAAAVDGGGLCTGKALPGSCPVKCFRADPVCGADGITYWCGCSEALCAGTRVASLGFCDVGDGGSGPVSGQALLLVQIVWLILLGFFASDLGLYDFYIVTEQRVNWDREEASDRPKVARLEVYPVDGGVQREFMALPSVAVIHVGAAVAVCGCLKAWVFWMRVRFSRRCLLGWLNLVARLRVELAVQAALAVLKSFLATKGKRKSGTLFRKDMDPSGGTQLSPAFPASAPSLTNYRTKKTTARCR
ncbi:hypothetical protein RJ640_028340 [Escallonia rubra]|uniref:Kazal-like domain-containing protein n=1 Tax=Escallonia rubra TaxID=112253 RepID=A0AA88UF38_9ASTE|nr:hypothetical protein RJ640_028340 [Escallonia rubra]